MTLFLFVECLLKGCFRVRLWGSLNLKPWPHSASFCVSWSLHPVAEDTALEKFVFAALLMLESLQKSAAGDSDVPLTCENIRLILHISVIRLSPCADTWMCLSLFTMSSRPAPPTILSFISPQLCVYLPLTNSISVSNAV